MELSVCVRGKRSLLTFKRLYFFIRIHVFGGFDGVYIGYAFYLSFFRDEINPLEIEHFYGLGVIAF